MKMFVLTYMDKDKKPLKVKIRAVSAKSAIERVEKIRIASKVNEELVECKEMKEENNG